MKIKGLVICAAAVVAIGLAGGYVFDEYGPKTIITNVEAAEEKPDNKIYEPGKHVCLGFYRWQYYGTDDHIEIPDGYEILDIEMSRASETTYLVWFINTETVEVEAAYNESDHKYSYSEPGKVIEKEKTK